jgi:hypothetical protein
MLPGETEEAYRFRIATLARRDAEAARVQAEAAQRAREDELWGTAERIAAAEVKDVSGWRRDRRGASYRVVTLRLITTARGPGGTTRLQLRSFDGGDACFGPLGPVYPSEGRLVLFTRKGKLSDATVIGWTNADLTTHPETLSLLARSEGAED